MKPASDIEEFLRESNAIEAVFDEDALLQAISAWHYLSTIQKLSVGDVLKAHKILMLHQPLMPNERGYFRQVTVRVGSEFKHFISVALLRDELEGLLHDMQNPELLPDDPRDYDKLCRLHHVIFERIHPFVDGNGRVGRLLYLWQRLKLGLPVHVIHRGKEQMDYYQWFRNAS